MSSDALDGPDPNRIRIQLAFHKPGAKHNVSATSGNCDLIPELLSRALVPEC